MSFISPGFVIHRGWNLILGDNATAAVDPFFANVSLLVPYSGGTNGQLITVPQVIDKSPTPHALVIVGGSVPPQYTTAAGETLFGNSTFKSDTDTQMNWGGSAGFPEFRMGLGDFTFECAVRPTVLANGAGGYNFFGTGSAFGTNGRWSIGTGSADANLSRATWFVDDTAAGLMQSGLGVMLVNTWVQLAYCREALVGRLYVNGIMVATAADATDYSSLNTNGIGQRARVGENSLLGQLANVRLTKGVARYTAAGYTPPTASFPITGP